jgi:hypothetical protein
MVQLSCHKLAWIFFKKLHKKGYISSTGGNLENSQYIFVHTQYPIHVCSYTTFTSTHIQSSSQVKTSERSQVYTQVSHAQVIYIQAYT